MKSEKLLNLLKDYIKNQYDGIKSPAIWENQSNTVKKYWRENIIQGSGELDKLTLDPILIILDNKARGAGLQSGVESVGFPYIYQDMWYEIFNDIKENATLKSLLNDLFENQDTKEEIELLNKIWKINTKKNGLTGENANAINDLMFVFNPVRNISILSLKHRYQILDFLGYGDSQTIDNGTYGQRIILSREEIIKAKKDFNANIDNRGWSKFFYWEPVKNLWQNKDKTTEQPQKEADIEPKSQHDKLIKLLLEYGEIFGFEAVKTPSVNTLRIGKEFSKNKTLDLAWKVAGVAWIAFEVQVHGSIPDLLHRFQLVNQSSLRLVVIVDESEHEHMKEAAGEYLFRDKLIAVTPEDVESAAKDYRALLNLRNKIFT